MGACRTGFAVEGILGRTDRDACRLRRLVGYVRFHASKGLFEGPYGVELMFAQPISANWERPSLDVVTQTVMKKYYSLIYVNRAGNCIGSEA
jgi:hypothetical protein